MAGSYVPPFRRSPAAGASSDAAPTEHPPPPSHETPNSRFNNKPRGGGGGRGSRGGRGGRGGRGRDYRNNFYQQQKQDQDQGRDPPIDDAYLYHLRDIESHFWGGEAADNIGIGKSSTFHGSKAHPDELKYVLLFIGANPRWAQDYIVFAKSNLNLLPGYKAKKAERGGWELPQSPKTAESPTEIRPQEGIVPASTEGTTEGTTGNTQSSAQDDAAVASQSQVTKDEKPKDDTDSNPAENGDVATETVGVSTSPINDNNQEVNVAPTETPKSTEDCPPEVSTTAAKSSWNSRLKYRDIRTIPANEYYPDQEPASSSPPFPTVPPIDYVLPACGEEFIAVFEECRPSGSRGSKYFIFVGWFRVARVNLLAPHSAELVRMQQQKWERRDRFGNLMPTRARDAAAWNAALGNEWAVVKFEIVLDGGLEEGEDAPLSPPAIKKLPEPERTRIPSREEGNAKDVNELLAELRLADRCGENAGPEKNTDSKDLGDEGGENQDSEKTEVADVENKADDGTPAPQG